MAKFHHHAPKNEAFEGCNHFIISGGSKVPEIDNLRALRGHLGPNGYHKGAIPSQTSAIPAESQKVTIGLTKVA